MKKMISLKVLLLICLVLTSAVITSAQTTTFAQYTSRGGGQDYIFTNNGTEATFTTRSGGAPVRFFYDNIAGLPAELSDQQNARVFVNATTTVMGSLNGGTLNQPFGTTAGTIQIIRDTPATIGNGARTNLLTITFSPNTDNPILSGGNGTSSATFSASYAPLAPAQNVTFTSDFLTFAATTQRNFSLSFSSVQTNFSLNANGFANSFTAAGTGTFASNPPPSLPPTASDIVIAGTVTGADGRYLRNARVTMTEANGTIHNIMTGSMGRFAFPGIEGGQTVVVSVFSKRYTFTSRLVDVGDMIEELNFSPSE